MKLLICNDGSDQAARAVRIGAAIAVACKADATLLGIIEGAGDSKGLLEALQRAQAMLGEKKVHAELITKSGMPLEEIVRRTQEANYDLVVIGAAHKQARGPFRMSSMSYKIIKAIHPPVLAVTGEM